MVDNNNFRYNSIAVVGGSRGVGYQFVKLALSKGHQVRVLLRSTEGYPLASESRLKLYKGDVLKLETLQDFIAGADCVVSTLGIKGMFGKTTVISEGMKNIIATMRKFNITRLISLSTVYISKDDPEVSFFHKKLASFVGGVFDDHIRNEKVLFESSPDINFTNVRAPRLTNKKGTRFYRVDEAHLPKKASKITREDTALAMYDILEADKYHRQTVHIGN